WSPAPSTETRSCILPGIASNVTRDGLDGAPLFPDAPPVPVAADVEAKATSGTRPRKYGVPASPTAMSATLCGSSWRPPSPGVFCDGSQTKVTRVLPFSPLDVPIQVRMKRVRIGSLTGASAAWTSGGAPGFLGAVARAVSSAVSAQYPFLDRTCTPRR